MDSVVEVLDLPAKRDTDVAQRELRILCLSLIHISEPTRPY